MAWTTSALTLVKGSLADPHAGLPPEFWDLVERYRSELIHQAFVVLGDRQEAEDAVQETFCEAYRQGPDLAKAVSLGALLRKINHANALDRLRARALQRGKAQRKQRDLPPRQATTGGFSLLEIKEEVTRAIEALSEEERTVVAMKYWEHLSYEEMARRLGVSAITVQRRHFEAMLQLYRNSHLARHVEGAPPNENTENSAR